MKLTRKISAVIILAVMIMSLIPSGAFAGFFENGILPTHVTLKDEFGEPIETLAPNTDIYAEITVRNFSGRLILAYYENNILKAINSQFATIGDEPDSVMASITTGSDVSNAKIQAFLWDGYSSSEILSKKADFSSGSCEIAGIYLDGVLLSDFDKNVHEYSCHLPVGSYDYPEIYAETKDLSTKVSISCDKFPGTATIKLESANKAASDTYTINFTRETGKINNIVMRTATGALNLTDSAVVNIEPPVFKTGNGAITDPTADGYYDTPNLETWTPAFSDSNSYINNYFLSLPENLYDASYIRLERSLRNPRTLENPNADPNVLDVLSFDINASADVYYVFMGNSLDDNKAEYTPWIDTCGWVNSGKTLEFVESNGSSASTQPKIKDIAKKSYRVAPGETTRVTIGGFNLSWFVPIVFVEFTGNNKNAYLKSVKADGVEIDSFDNSIYEYKYVLDLNETPPENITAEADYEGANVLVDKQEEDGVTTFTVRVTSVDNSVSNTFKFIYTEKKPEVTNASFKVFNSTTVTETRISSSNIVTSGFIDPVFKDGAVTDTSSWKHYSTSNLTNWFSAYSNTNYLKNNYFYSIPEEMKDAIFIRSDRTWREPRTNAKTPNAMKTQSEVLTFDINKTAYVYYVLPGSVSNATWLTDEAWTEMSEKAIFVESSGGNDTDAVPAKTHTFGVYKKKFEVADGETLKVKIGGYYQNYYVPFVFVKWVEE